MNGKKSQWLLASLIVTNQKLVKMPDLSILINGEPQFEDWLFLISLDFI